MTAATGIVLVQLGGRGLEISVNKDDRLTGNGSEAIKKSALESIFFFCPFTNFFFFFFLKTLPYLHKTLSPDKTFVQCSSSMKRRALCLLSIVIAFIIFCQA